MHFDKGNERIDVDEFCEMMIKSGKPNPTLILFLSPSGRCDKYGTHAPIHLADATGEFAILSRRRDSRNAADESRTRDTQNSGV